MSWHMKENYEISEIHPRKQPPKGHGQNNLARVQPMVPEVSQFSTSRPPFRAINGENEDSLCRTILSKQPPQPQIPPNMPSQISKMGEPSKTEDFDKQKALLNNPEDLFKVLTWQSEQLMRLQEQVHQLLACQTSPNSSILSNSSRSKMVDSSTQVSTPNSPLKQSFLRQNRTEMTPQEPSFVPESLPLGASAGLIPSPPKFEESEDDDEIECHDVQPVEDIDQLIGQFDKLEAEKPMEKPEESCFEVKRLRDMGVSFISKEDLYQNKKKEENSLWYPQAMDPFQSGNSVTSTSDYSLMINSAALKYLNDAQLAHVAKKSNSGFEPANVTTYGLPEQNISASTRNFLSQNHLKN